MKYLLSILLIPILSSGVEVEYNLYTQHYFEDCYTASLFENKVADCGRGIANPIIGIKNENFRLLVGKQSVGSPMVGVTYTDDIFVMGAYLQDTRTLNKKQLMAIGIPLGDSLMLTPIVGIELERRYKKAKVFTVITPILFTIGVGYAY